MSNFINKGGLWDNQRKYEPTDPDFTGSINIGGAMYSIAGWMNTSTNLKSPNINLVVTPPHTFDIGKTIIKDDDDIPF